MYVVKYSIQGDKYSPETGYNSAFTIAEYGGPNSFPTLSNLKESFPFCGRFHFRLKTTVPTEEEFIWVDLREDNQTLPFKNGIIEVKVLPLSFEEDKDETKYDDIDFRWLPEDIKLIPLQETKLPTPDDDRGSALEKEVDGSKQGIEAFGSRTLEVTRNVSRFGKAIWGALTGPMLEMPSIPARDMLHVTAHLLETPFDERNKSHEALLYKFWTALNPENEYHRHGPGWKRLGFQNTDPMLDMKGSGILGINCLAHFATSQPMLVQDMIGRQSIGDPQFTYPFAIVAKNISLMLADIFHIKNREFIEAKHSFWPIFEEGPDTYLHMFVLSFQILDKEWADSRATRSQFAQVIRQTKLHIEGLLSHGSPNVSDIQQAALDANLIEHL